MNHPMPIPWRVEGRATPFSPWTTILRFVRLETACSFADSVKISHKWYATRVRAF